MDSKLQNYIFFLSILGAGLIWFSSVPHGLGISGDAVHYLSSADYLGRGLGFINNVGKILIMSPPLYPIMLLVISLVFSTSFLTAGLIINIVVYAGIIYLGGKLFFDFHDKNKARWALLGVILLLFSRPIFNISVNIAQDPIFTVLTILYFLSFHKYFENPKWKTLFYIAGLVSIIFFIRYVGLLLIISGGITFLYYHRTNIKEAIQKSLVFGLIASAPTLAWIFGRNYRLTGDLVGQGITDKDPLSNLIFSSARMINWIVPEYILKIIPGTIIVAIAILFILWISSKTQRNQFMQEMKKPRNWILWIFSISYYLGMLYFTIPKHHILPHDDRYYIELYIPILFVIFNIFDILIIPNIKYPKVLNGLFVLWLIFPAFSMIKTIGDIKGDGGTVYNIFNIEILRNAEVFDYVNNLPANSTIYSNCPRCMYLYTDFDSYPSPKTIEELQNPSFPFMDSENEYFVWFERWTYDGDFLQPEIILNELEIKHIENFPKIQVYAIWDE
jgi:hypothetical protein